MKSGIGVRIAALLVPLFMLAGVAHAGSSPTIAVNSPLGTVTSWVVDIDWGDATTCQYAIDSTAPEDLITLDTCDNSIPAPAAGSHYLHIVATNESGPSSINASPFDYEPPNNPPVAGWNSEPSQSAPSDTTVTVDVHVNDTESDTVSYSVEYSLNGGVSWSNANHLSGAAFPISGNTITGITTYGDGVNNRSNVAFYWNYTEDQSTASTTNAEIRVTPHDAHGDGDPIVSDPFTLRAPPAAPAFAEDSGAITDITENSVIVGYNMSTVGSAPLHHFELDYASDDYYTAHSSYAENTPITYTGAFADTGATNIDSLACGTTYHYIQAFTNDDGLTATSTDATFTTSDCTGGGGGDSGGGGGSGAPFTDGDGSSDAPYIIDDCAQIPTINDHLSASYLLTTDLDCSALGTDAMIGAGGSFTGTFDGGGHSIRVDMESDSPGVGLFSIVYGATIENLAIAPESVVLGAYGVGSIAGLAVDSTITNVSSWATVVSSSATAGYPPTGTGGILGGLYGGAVDGAEFWGIAAAPYAVGGIAGIVVNDLSDGPGGIISRSDSKGQIYGGTLVGGVAGYITTGGQIRNSYSSGPVAYDAEFVADLPASGGFGGLVGALDDGVISRSYAAGSVTAGTEDDLYPSGGLVGFVLSPDAIIVHSFSASEVTSAGAVVGGLLGGVDEEDAAFTGLYDDFYDTERTGQAVCAAGDSEARDGCRGVDGTADGYWLQTEGTPLSFWDRTSVWDVSGEEFPELFAASGPLPEESDAFTGADDTGDEGDGGTEEPHVSHTRSHSHALPIAQASGAPAANMDSLQAALAVLMKQYEALLAQGSSVGPAGAFSRDLSVGASGSDVVSLQAFLIAHGYAIPSGATGYFGAQTRAALAAYQAASGILPAAGYFGPRTRAHILAP